ncbi:conjugal transfer protein TraH [Pseudoalteromonas luteoviolacea]|uniref:conjugal transfer protein TraH n=1 Tax=Pseudoalteromonas luteoviolacea TaxID=43657 RepID=UPI001B35D4D1|nr:conjugal transfer protein TraH [Pseudoalteromonas luteoviolacea]MBQ4839849.1 conjugal transfer protein TraH [Pseudoalteromonas luteoviolacea]
MNMIKYIGTVLLCVPGFSHAGWVDDWFDNATSSGTSTFKNQQRGFYSLGGMQGRINTTVENPISVQLPKLSGGCGGVNLFYGGISLMDEEYLVQKLENSMQAAPAIAFDMAVKTVTKEFSESLAKFEQITNALNGLQLDDCAIAKSAVTTVVDGRFSDVGGEVLSTITNEQSLFGSTSKNYHESQDKINTANGKPTEDLSSQWQGCHADFKDLFTKQGSLVSRASSKFGMSSYASIVRGYIGDVTVNLSTNGKIPIGREVMPCPKNADSSLDDFIYGLSEGRSATGSCSRYTTKGVQDMVEDNLKAIATSISNKTALSASTLSWINKAPLPVYRLMYRASIDGTVDETIMETSELLSYAYAHRMFDDMHRNALGLLHNMNKVFEESGQGTNYGRQCNKDLFIGIAPLLPKLETRLRETRNRMRQGYVAKLEEYQSMANFIDRQEKIENKRKRKPAQDTLGLGGQAQ